MARLPTIGDDLNAWGNILNEFLLVAHNPDGTLIVAPFTNPMTGQGDLITGGLGGLAQRLGIGANGQYLSIVNGVPAWAQPPGGFINPMTTAGDIIVAIANGIASRLALGANGQVLTVSGGNIVWANPASGFANPMTTRGDVITATIGGVAQRLALGANGQVLGSNGTDVIWLTNPAGFANPMTSPSDVIIGGVAGAAQRLPVGANGQFLGVSSGALGYLNLPIPGVVVPPSGDHTGVTDNAAIMAALNAGQNVILQSGNYYITGLALNTGTLYQRSIVGNGMDTVLNMVSAGNAIKVQNPVLPSSPDTSGTISGRFARFQINGAGHAAGASAGMWVGDLKNIYLEVSVLHFNQANDQGFHFVNSVSSLNDVWGHIGTADCTTHVMFDVDPAGRGETTIEQIRLICEINAVLNGQTGMLFNAGAQVASSFLRIQMGVQGGGTAYSITGQLTGTYSHLADSFIWARHEVAGGGVGNPTTINFGTPGSGNNSISDCAGFLQFQSTWTQSNASGNCFQFDGVITGDATLLAQKTLPHNNYGWSNSTITTPAVPASGNSVTNNRNVNVLVYFNGARNAPTQVNGVAYGDATANPVFVGSGDTVTPFYSPPGSLSWTWQPID